MGELRNANELVEKVVREGVKKRGEYIGEEG